MNAATATHPPVARPGWLDWLRRELAPFPGRDATTVRIVVTVVLVVIISMALQVPQLTLSAYMVFFVTKENKVVTTLIGVLLILGVTIAIAASLLIYRWTFDYPELRLPAMAVVIFAGFFFSRVFVIGPLAFAIAFILAVTQSIAELMPSAEYLVQSLLWLWVAMAYPIVLTVVVNQLLLPAHPRTELVRELQRRLDATTGLIERKLGTATDTRADNALRELATRGSAGLLKLLSFAEMADPPLKRQHPPQTAAIMATERLVTAAAALALREREHFTPDDLRCLEAIRTEAARLRMALPQPSINLPPMETNTVVATLLEIGELQRALALLRESIEGETAGSAEPASSAKPRKRLLAADAFTNPAHAHFALKVTLAAMLCYILYTAVDWAGIHTAFITCCIISLESTGATLRKGALRLAGCVVGGLLGFLSLMYLIPQMESITSLALLVAAVTALAGWVAAGSERISYAGLQIAFAYYMCVFQGFAPDTDFNKIRDRLVGIVLGITVITLVFRYVWPERATERLRAALAKALRSLARLLALAQPQTSSETATLEAGNLRSEITSNLDETLRLAEVTTFEEVEAGPLDTMSANTIETLVARTQGVFLTATLLTNDAGLAQWQRLPEPVQRAERELRNAAAAQLVRTAAWLADGTLDGRSDLAAPLAAWNRLTSQAPSESSSDGRLALVRRLATQAQQIGRKLTPG